MTTNNIVSDQEHLPIDEITSPLGDQIFQFCESDLFPEPLQNSEVASSTNCCYEDHSSYPTPLSITIDNELPPPVTAAPNSPTPRPPTLPIFMEDQTIEDDISASIDFNLSPSFPHENQYFPNNQEPFPLPSLADHQTAGEGQLYGPMVGPPECQLPPMPAYNIRLRSSSAACTLTDPVIGPYLSSSNNMNNAPFSFDNPWLFSGGTTGLSFLGNDHLSNQEMESQGDNGGFFMHDSLARVFNCSTGDLQKTLGSEGQHLLSGSPGTTLASEISSLEDPTFKVGKISAEERKRKINRYLKKRNERNFSKKIKYACRKTLADSRPRVRGRFAKNDELNELARSAGNGHEDDVDDDVRLFSNHIPHDHHHKVVKEEGSVDAIDRMLANINDVNSFTRNAYPIQSWIN